MEWQSGVRDHYEGHGYVRLLNQGTYVGGFVEIGKDVIVPVTADMLVAVGEGDYTLRISKNGYSGEKSIRVTKDRELNVDISDIAIPSGTVTFAVTPEDANEVIKVDGEVIANRTYTGLYGDHELSITADGYDSFRGSFKITETMKTLRVTLQQKRPKRQRKIRLRQRRRRDRQLHPGRLRRRRLQRHRDHRRPLRRRRVGRRRSPRSRVIKLRLKNRKVWAYISTAIMSESHRCRSGRQREHIRSRYTKPVI